MGPKVLITGASRGIGEAVARFLANKGYEVTGTSRHPERIANPIPGVQYITLDLNRIDSIERCIDQTGSADILINNAGESRIAPAEVDLPDRIRDIFQIHIHGPIRLIQGFLPGMREKRMGWIINIGSLAGIFPVPFQSAYSSAKSALAVYSQSLRSEVWDLGVRVVMVNPNDIRTTIQPEIIIGQVPDYHAPLQRMQTVRTERMTSAQNPDLVARKIGTILLKKRPAPAYSVGGAAPLLVFARRWLPDRWAESLIRRTYNL
ncbi:MAG TPA: SDR family NAD(P)-dependent oxidoreductase [bacterium]|nr:SDR family NAD(P)-dependent oxidoreductase [bacterium]